MNTENKINFAGFDDWVEIFAGGRQTDSAGATHDGNALIDSAVETFDTSYHEPPLVVGHPKDDAPAFGWVESLKADTKNGVKRLYAKFRNVVPDFEEMVKTGRYKKRSASFYPDGRLRHVGWLGAMPPAVKGLSDVSFSADDQAMDFDFEENTNQKQQKKEKTMKFSEFIEALKFWSKIQDDPDADLPVFVGAGHARDPKTPPDAGKQFTEADIEAAKKEAAAAAKAEAEAAVRAEFAESQAKAQKEAAKAKITTLIDDGVKSGKIAPAWKAAGIAEFMESLDTSQAIEFGEGDAKFKKTGLDWFIDFLDGLPALINFDEIATRDKDVNAGGAGAKLDGLVKKRIRESDGKLTYTAAFMEVCEENEALAEEYHQELHG